jgi:alpha-L-rhamnosidase
MWERWNSYTLETGFGDPAMNSFNHYAYGAVGEWLYSTLGGIAPQESSPGYAVVRSAPFPCAGVSWVRTWHETPRGRLSVNWRLSRLRRFSMSIVVPPDTEADVILPGASIGDVRHEGPRLVGGGVDAGVTLRVGSGHHRFAYHLAKPRLAATR